MGTVGPVPDRIARRLAAVPWRSGSVLLAADTWQGAELCLQVVAATWEDVGQGHGVLRRPRMRMAAAGRGAATTLPPEAPG